MRRPFAGQRITRDSQLTETRKPPEGGEGGQALKISGFCLAVAGLAVSFQNESDWLPAALFGALAFQAYRRIMLEVQILETGEEEGGEEPWVSLGHAIQHWRRRR